MKVGSLVRPCEQLNNAAGWFGVVVEMREALSREGLPGVYALILFLGDPPIPRRLPDGPLADPPGPSKQQNRSGTI